MATRPKSAAISLLEKVNGGPLTFRQLLRATRECDEYTQAQFARKLGISKQHLSDIENGRKFVSAERAYHWAKKLGYMEMHWAQLALQDMLDNAGLRVRVTLEPSTSA